MHDDTDKATDSHQRAPYSDPLAGNLDPTSPGAPHEPGGTDYNQSKEGQERGRDDNRERTNPPDRLSNS
jgi:hypothetical protein